mgnify:CR=1 FL=1
MIGDMRRSVLYVPCDSETKIGRAARIPADVLLFNLEDGVAASHKDAARAAIARALGGGGLGGREHVVRINSLASDTGARDLAAVVPGKPDGICLPKIEGAGQVEEADARIRDLEILHGIPEGTIGLHAMVESAAGVLAAAEIAAASPRMASLIFGSADFALDLRCRPGKDRAEFLLAMQMLVLAARAAGIDAIDAPCFDIRDPEQLRRESAAARRLGFDGKSALHPGQLDVIHEAFDVSPEDLAWAEKVLEELDAAERRGRALAVLDGTLVDNPHRAAALRILRRRPAGRK